MKLENTENPKIVDKISTTIERGKTPEAWCDLLFKHHKIKMSSRSLRKIARKMGLCLVCGRDILILPEQLDAILENNTCRLKSIKETKLGGSRGGSMNYRAANTIAKAHIHLQKQARAHL